MKKIVVIFLTAICLLSLTACKNNEEVTPKYSSKYSYSAGSNSTNKTKHYCDAPSCTKEGTKKYEGITGQTEYYCYTHYNEIVDMLSDMEEDVGNSSYSKHTCEECSREGTHSIIGISGSREYYCSTHYKELQELLDMLN